MVNHIIAHTLLQAASSNDHAINEASPCKISTGTPRVATIDRGRHQDIVEIRNVLDIQVRGECC
jgi:hypothetical protein